MKSRKWLIVLALMTMTAISMASVVVTVSNIPEDVADTYIAKSYGWFSAPTGSDDTLHHCYGDWSNAANYLIRFDALMAALPEGITSDDIVSARLGLYRYDDNGISVTASRIVAADPFVETTTWTVASANNQRQWYNLTIPDATMAMDSVSGYKWADVTGLVNGWVDGETNNGFLICNYAGTSWSGFPGVKIYSSDYADTNYRPILEITYVPEPATMVMVGLGCVGFVLRQKQK